MDKNIHNDKRYKREKSLVVLDGVNLEHDEGLVEQTTVYVLIQSSLICAATIELRQRVVVRRKVNTRNFVLVADVRYALSTVFKEAVERQFINNQSLASVFHFLNLLPNTFLHLFVGVGRLALCGCFNEEFLVQGIYLGLVVAFEAYEIGFIVLLDNLLNKQLLYLCRYGGAAFPNEHDKVLQKVYFLHVQLLSLYAERIHCDRMFFRIADVFATDILTQSLIGVTGINHNNIGILLP